MRIVLLTPGTGNFYCGNCLRDNALANELRAEGHEALMVPLYLPHVVDEPEAAEGVPIFFGGINVYLEQKLSLFRRRTPAWLDRMLNSTRLLRWAADRSNMTGAADLGELTLSMLRGEEGKQNKELSKLIDWLREQGPIDAVCLSNALLIGLGRRIREELGAAIVCTLAGEDAFLDSLIEPYRSRAWDLLGQRAADVDGFIAVSRYYGDVMRRRLGLDDTGAERVHVVYNGINLDGYEPAEAPPDPPVLGYLARMCPEKGLDTLIGAFITLKQRDRVPGLKLRVAGAQTPADRSFVRKQQRRLAKAGLADEAEFLPNIDHGEKLAFLRSLSMLSVPATYGEAFGLYVLEALASGVPVVQPRHAAFEELLEELGGGILCEPNDPAALADAIEIMLLRGEEARQMALTGRERVFQRFTVQRMAQGVLEVCREACSTRTGAAPAQSGGG